MIESNGSIEFGTERGVARPRRESEFTEGFLCFFSFFRAYESWRVKNLGIWEENSGLVRKKEERVEEKDQQLSMLLFCLWRWRCEAGLGVERVLS